MIRIEAATRVDRILRMMKNHPLVTPLVIIGVVVVALANFTTSIDQIIAFSEKHLLIDNPPNKPDTDHDTTTDPDDL